MFEYVVQFNVETLRPPVETISPPENVEVEVLVTARFVTVVVPIDPDPAIERFDDPVMNPVETPARVEVPVTRRVPEMSPLSVM